MSGRSAWHCALCGASARAPFRAPQPEVAPDLDLGPLPNFWRRLFGE